MHFSWTFAVMTFCKSLMSCILQKALVFTVCGSWVALWCVWVLAVRDNSFALYRIFIFKFPNFLISTLLSSYSSNSHSTRRSKAWAVGVLWRPESRTGCVSCPAALAGGFRSLRMGWMGGAGARLPFFPCHILTNESTPPSLSDGAGRTGPPKRGLRHSAQ